MLIYIVALLVIPVIIYLYFNNRKLRNKSTYALPKHVKKYKQTKVFNNHTLPKALQRKHNTKSDVWGKLVVTKGKIYFVMLSKYDDGDPTLEVDKEVLVEAGCHVVIPPGYHHFVWICEDESGQEVPFECHVEFLK